MGTEKYLNLKEQIDPGQGNPDWIDPKVRHDIESGDVDLNQILPYLSEGDQTYLEKISSERYQQLLSELSNLIGQDLMLQDFGSLYNGAGQALMQAVQIEASHTEQLQQLAVELVLSLPENEMLKPMLQQGLVRIDAKLGMGEMEDIEIGEMGGSNSDEDEDDDQIAVDNVMFEVLNDIDLDEEALKRRYANAMIHGNAIHKFRAWRMVQDQIEQIDDQLPAKYGFFIAVSETGYWAIQPTDIDMKGFAGSEQVIPEEDGYVIKARGAIFPLLVHELVKGITEYFSLGGANANVQQKGINAADTVEKEWQDIRHGPSLWKRFQLMIPPQDQQYALPVFQHLLRQNQFDISEVIDGGEYGQQIIQDILAKVKAQYQQYRDSLE